jgi:hypothetical protein
VANDVVEMMQHQPEEKNMSNKNDGSPDAFPHRDAEGFHAPGMTLRDYFAGLAQPEAMATEMRERMARAEGQDYATREEAKREAMTLAAEFSYAMADAMLRARETK